MPTKLRQGRTRHFQPQVEQKYRETRCPFHGCNQQTIEKKPSAQAQMGCAGALAPSLQKLCHHCGAGMLQAAGYLRPDLLPCFNGLIGRKSKRARKLVREPDLICQPPPEVA